MTKTASPKAGEAEWVSPNGEFNISVAGGRSERVEPVDFYWKRALRELGRSVTYKKRGNSWFVLSGVDENGEEYYYKVHVRGRNWTGLTLSYPHAKNRRYDPWVERVEDTFVPFAR